MWVAARSPEHRTHACMAATWRWILSFVFPGNSSSVVSDSCSHKDAIEIVPTVSCPFQKYR